MRVDRVVKDGDAVSLGGTRLVARITPGHTKGCTTWTTRVAADGAPRDVVFLCSVTGPGYRLVGNPEYPDIADDFRRSLRILATLPCDIFLAPHGSFFDLAGKRALLGKDGPNPFVDAGALKRHVEARAAELEHEIADQKGGPR